MDGILAALSTVFVYGRLEVGIKIEQQAIHSRFAQNLLARNADCGTPQFAVVYGYEFQGRYSTLEMPTLLLVFGEGESPVSSGAIAPFSSQLADDVRVWTFDKSELGVKMDLDTGAIESLIFVDSDRTGNSSITTRVEKSGARENTQPDPRRRRMPM